MSPTGIHHSKGRQEPHSYRSSNSIQNSKYTQTYPTPVQNHTHRTVQYRPGTVVYYYSLLQPLNETPRDTERSPAPLSTVGRYIGGGGGAAKHTDGCRAPRSSRPAAASSPQPPRQVRCGQVRCSTGSKGGNRSRVAARRRPAAVGPDAHTLGLAFTRCVHLHKVWHAGRCRSHCR